ncbi:glycosyltransferase [Lewinella sp. 4G2]|uniref:glycosyltransferase n=1 Tax=Lewinella sp. 4G2 TaxID=1803372 RepID=UPI0007B4A46A|nr:glycosyltransferase [Lewinella sp. 4G2]OAV45717.1 hypothetical protein A3850_014990 [Lewinella sp. 4G2]
MARPQLLVVTPWYPNRLNGHDGNFVANTTRLVAPDYAVTVLAVIEDKQLERGLHEVLTTQEDGIHTIRVYFGAGTGRARRTLFRMRAWEAGIRELSGSYALIHAHVLIDGGIVAARLAKRWGIPLVISAHASRWFKRWPVLRMPDRHLAVRAANQANAVLPVSQALLERLKHYGIQDHLTICSNPVDESIFFPPEVEREATGFTFLHVSDFSPNKQVGLLLSAFAELCLTEPTSQLQVGGDGDPKTLDQLIEESLREHPLEHRALVRSRITTFGVTDAHGIADRMRAADCFLLTSFFETQSVVLLEAQLCGLPAISTRSGGPEGIITSTEHGQLFEVEAKDQLVAAMSSQIHAGRPSLEQRQSLSAIARERYGNAAIRKQLLDIYKFLINA